MPALLWFGGAIVALAALAWFFWDKIKGWLKDSETLLWARLQVIAGAVWTALSQADVNSIFNALGYGKYVGLGLLVMGIITELARRNRASDL